MKKMFFVGGALAAIWIEIAAKAPPTKGSRQNAKNSLS